MQFGLEIANGVDVGTVTGSSTGTSITPNASANTKGSYTQLVASTASDACWMGIAIVNAGEGAYLVDIAIGAAASEVVILPNLMVQNSIILNFAQHYSFPVSFPGGTRLSARCQSATASDAACLVSVQLFDGTFKDFERGGVDAIGVQTASSQGVSIDPGGTANTKGSYVQLVASTSVDYLGLVPCFDNLNNANAALSSNTQLIDIAIGAAASEVVIIPDLLVRRSDGGATMLPPTGNFYPIQIPAGTRLSARSQSSVNTSPSRLAGVSLYGVYR